MITLQNYSYSSLEKLHDSCMHCVHTWHICSLCPPNTTIISAECRTCFPLADSCHPPLLDAHARTDYPTLRILSTMRDIFSSHKTLPTCNTLQHSTDIPINVQKSWVTWTIHLQELLWLLWLIYSHRIASCFHSSGKSLRTSCPFIQRSVSKGRH